MKPNKIPSFKLERKLLKTNNLIFGMDEVGRGSFAGPLIASAVCFETQFTWFKTIKDSKLLTHNKREQLSRIILDNSISFVEEVNVKTINKSGIGNANKLIFQKMLRKIEKKHNPSTTYFLIDGRKIFDHPNTKFIIKGDQKSVSIAAASIIAKVYRDNLMIKLNNKFPLYNLAQNKGYGTKFHRDALKKHGISKIHRKSFKLTKYL